MRQFHKTGTFRILAAVVLLIGLYALAGFWLAPKLVRKTMLQEIPKTLVGITPSIGKININPFLLQVEIRDFVLTGPQGTRLAGFERLFVDFQVSSLWHRAYTFSNIDLSSPFANAVIFKDGRLNLAQLSPKTPDKPRLKSKEPVPALRIGSFKVTQGFLSFDDRRRPSDFATRLQPINFELQNFMTGVDGGRFTFSGISKLGERIDWHGHIAVQPLESDGEIVITDLQAHTIWSYLEDQLSFLVNSGKIDLTAAYRFSLKDAVDLKVNVPKVILTDFTVRPKNSELDWITLPELTLSGTTMDLRRREVQSESLALSGLRLRTWFEPDGSLNLLKLAAAPATAVGTPAATHAATAATSPDWKFRLAELALRNADISAEDRRTKPNAKLQLASLSIKVRGASLDLAKPLAITLDTKINDAGRLNLSGTVTPQPLAADLTLKLADIGLAAAQPYIAQYTSMTLLAGSLSGDASVKYAAQKPAMQLKGSLRIAKLHTVDNALHDDFINWDRLDIKGLKFQHDPDRLDIEEVAARKLYARVIIEPDESINVKRILAGPGATVIAPGDNSGPPVSAMAAPAPRPVAVASHSAVMPIRIKRVVVRASQANFADLSVMPNFATGIQNLEGSVIGLSSKQASRAKVDFHGAVDPFAPVSISGEINVLSAALYADLAMSFRNIELSLFNPYSGKFAGYDISKGKLTTELHYKVVGRKLDAQHHIIVDQLEFGAKTDSKDAVSLPVKLAVALLKDRNGVIDINLPVTGSLDDPQFSLGPVIWKVLVKFLEKAVTAPFALLGSLFGGGPDLKFIDFQPGTADLDPVAVDKARSIVKALNARPQLKLEIPIAVIADLDRPGLAEAKFQEQLEEAQATAGKKSHPGATGFAQLDARGQFDLLTKLYSKNFGADPKFPEAIDALKDKHAKLAAKNDFLSKELHQHMIVSESDLTALGQQRAINLQHALLSGTQIDPQRVYLVVNDKAKTQDGRIRLELSLH